MGSARRDRPDEACTRRTPRALLHPKASWPWDGPILLESQDSNLDKRFRLLNQSQACYQLHHSPISNTSWRRVSNPLPSVWKTDVRPVTPRQHRGHQMAGSYPSLVSLAACNHDVTHSQGQCRSGFRNIPVAGTNDFCVHGRGWRP